MKTMRETYFLSVLVDGNKVSNCNCSNRDMWLDIMRSTHNAMETMGYQRTNLARVRNGEAHLTTYSMNYTRR